MPRRTIERPTPSLERRTDGGVQSIEELEPTTSPEPLDEVVRPRLKVGPPTEIDLSLAPDELGVAAMIELTQASITELDPETEETEALDEDARSLEAAMEALDEVLAEEFAEEANPPDRASREEDDLEFPEV